MTLTLAEKADLSIRLVRESKELAYDTETSGVDWKKNSPVGYVTSNSEVSVYIPIRHGGGGNLAAPGVLPMKTAEDKGLLVHPYEKALAEAFNERNRLGYKTVGHNIKFDAHFSANAEIMLGRNLEDTMNSQALLDEFSYSYSLDSCAASHGVQAKKGEPLYEELAKRFGGKADKGQMANYWRIEGNNPIAVDYAEGDGITTIGLWKAQQPRIEEDGLRQIHDLEQQLIWTIFKMERRGIKVDQPRLHEVRKAVGDRIVAATRALPLDYNSQSNPQTHKLMEEAGYTDWPVTPSGNPSFPEKWLKKNPIGKAIVEKRKMQTLENRYIRPILESHLFNGRVHTNLSQLKGDEYGTITGRFACNDPNLQAIHKRDKELGRLFRSIYVADEGYDFYEGDYSQCEPRLFAHYSEDSNLVQGYNSSPFKDVHQIVAEMFNVERDPTAKRMNMGIFTGMYPEAFADHMGWDIEFARMKWDQWFELFPGIRKFQDLAKQTMKRRGYVKTLLGRRCRLDHARFAYRATSRIIQGGNADILKYKMLEMDKFCEAIGEETIHLLMTVHDSLNWQAKQGIGKTIIEDFIYIMEAVQISPFNLIVPFVVDWKAGPNWAIATYGEEK